VGGEIEPPVTQADRYRSRNVMRLESARVVAPVATARHPLMFRPPGGRCRLYPESR